FLPRTSRDRIGKSRRIFSTSNPLFATFALEVASIGGSLAAVVIRSPPNSSPVRVGRRLLSGDFGFPTWLLSASADTRESTSLHGHAPDSHSFGPDTRWQTR